MSIVPSRSWSAFAPIIALGALVLLGCPMPGSAPEAPFDLEGSALSSTAISLAWHDMSDDEQGFRVERKLASDVSYAEVATLAADTTSWNDAGLTASTAYTYRVYAYNRRGDSMASNTVTVATTAAPPTAPTGLNATAISTSQIDLSWTEHSANETGFKVERSTTGTGGWSLIATLSVNANYYSNTGLPSGTLYYYRVFATSAVGNSGYSNVANATTLSLPAAPSGLSASAFSATQVDLAWTDNATNETGFKIERSPNGSTSWTEIATTGANVASYNNTGLASGSAYYYRVRATNAAGDSAYSNSAGLTLSVPAPPTGLTATAFSTTQINLAWTDAANNETGYRVERSPDGSTGWAEIASIAANSSGYSNTGLVGGVTWHYRVRAVNGLGFSAYSGTASATTPSLPAAPSLLTATPVSGTRIDLAWTDNATNETGFKVERRANAGTWAQIATPAANATTHVNSTGLAAGNTYDYRIRASNAVGDSGYSATATVVFTVPAAPSGLTATGTSTSQIGLAWTDNSGNETGFDVERSLNGTSGWSLLTTTSANTVSYQNTGVPAGAKYHYRVRAKNSVGSSPNSGTASGASLPPAQAFKVANSWGVGFSNEKVPDGFYYITYNAFKAVSMYTLFMDDIAAYTPRLIVTLQMSHARRGDCYVQVGVGSHASPVAIKTFNNAAWLWGDANPFPSNVMALDVTEFLDAARTNNLFLKVYDATTTDGGTADVGSITSFKVEQYTTSYGGTPAKTISGTGMPKSTVDGSTVYVDVATSGNLLAGAALAAASPSRISSLVNAHPITPAELATWKQRVGVAEKGKNYNKIIDGHGTGLRPPTEEEWAELARTTMVIDSLKYDKLGAPPSVDLSASTAFPPIGNQASQGSCVAWSIGYYIKTFQEALERGWNLSTVKMIGSWPAYYPDSQLDHLMSPTWIYNQINGGVDNGAAYVHAADLVFNLGAATWNTVPYTVSNYSSWPSEAGYREAPRYRGAKPPDAEWGMHYVLNVTTDAQIAILKTLLSSNIPVSISIDANKYSTLTSDDLWDVANYVSPSTNHANTLVGYRD